MENAPLRPSPYITNTNLKQNAVCIFFIGKNPSKAGYTHTHTHLTRSSIYFTVISLQIYTPNKMLCINQLLPLVKNSKCSPLRSQSEGLFWQVRQGRKVQMLWAVPGVGRGQSGLEARFIIQNPQLLFWVASRYSLCNFS